MQGSVAYQDISGRFQGSILGTVPYWFTVNSGRDEQLKYYLN